MVQLFKKKSLRQGCQIHFHWGPHQPHSCLQRAKCNFNSLTVKEQLHLYSPKIISALLLLLSLTSRLLFQIFYFSFLRFPFDIFFIVSISLLRFSICSFIKSLFSFMFLEHSYNSYFKLLVFSFQYVELLWVDLH